MSKVSQSIFNESNPKEKIIENYKLEKHLLELF